MTGMLALQFDFQKEYYPYFSRDENILTDRVIGAIGAKTRTDAHDEAVGIRSFAYRRSILFPLLAQWNELW